MHRNKDTIILYQALNMIRCSSPGVNDPVVEVDGHGYTSYNRFGEHYWFVDLDMDCSNTVDDWFEFKVNIR